jgi:hypothetical protein
MNFQPLKLLVYAIFCKVSSCNGKCCHGLGCTIIIPKQNTISIMTISLAHYEICAIINTNLIWPSYGPHASSNVPINSRKYGIVLLYGIYGMFLLHVSLLYSFVIL